MSFFGRRSVKADFAFVGEPEGQVEVIVEESWPVCHSHGSVTDIDRVSSFEVVGLL